MNEKRFWEIISLLNWTQDDDNAVIEPAVNALSKHTIAEIYKFDDILSEKLYALDHEKYAKNIGRHSINNSSNDNFFSDIFLFARACVVANGREIYQEVLENPEEMPKDIDFEPLLYLAEKAYSRKTKKSKYTHAPAFCCETYSNTEGWNIAEPVYLSQLLSV